jgi:hypothetical protein
MYSSREAAALSVAAAYCAALNVIWLHKDTVAPGAELHATCQDTQVVAVVVDDASTSIRGLKLAAL